MTANTGLMSAGRNRLMLAAGGLLVVAHLPLVFEQCRRLWALEYYQFFPFAFLAFGVLFYQRRMPRTLRWDAVNSALIVVDLGLLIAGVVIYSPQAVYLGMLLLCLVACRSCLDAEYNRSLAYLWLLPLVTLRLPLRYDEQIIHWLQSATTKAGSLLLNQFGFLHLREGNVLIFPGRQFLVEEACSGVQSLFTVLFLACLIVCGYRRNWVHAAVVLVSGFAVAGLMNTLRICTISVAWSTYQLDLSTGWQHDALGYCALLAAAGLVVSADALLSFCLDPVPDARGGGISFLFRNPLIAAWNSVLRVERRGA